MANLLVKHIGPVYSVANMIAYYKMNNNHNDYFGVHDATQLALYYETGLEEEYSSYQIGSYTGEVSQFVIPYHSDFDFGDVAGDFPYSVSGMFKWDATTGAQWLVNKRDATDWDWQIYLLSGKLGVNFNDKAAGAYIGADVSFAPTIGVWYSIIVTYNGNSLPSGFKIYIDKVSQTLGSLSSGTYVKNNNQALDIVVGKAGHNDTFNLTGGIEGLVPWDKELTQTEIDEIVDRQSAGLPLVGSIDSVYQDTETNHDIYNNEKVNLFIGFAHAQYNCAAYYKNGYTVFSTMGNIEEDYEQFIYLYNHSNGKISKAVSWGSEPSADFHAASTVLFLPSGKILIASEKEHNNQILLKRSTNAYDISAFSTVENLTGSGMAYGNMILIGTRVWMINRTGPVYENGIRYSDDDGDNWSALETILDLDNHSLHWAYPRVVYSNDKLMFFVNRRNTDGTDVYDRAYYLESDDGETWENIQGTFSLDVTLGTPITETELNTNCLVFDESPDDEYISATCAWNNAPFYISNDRSSPGSLKFGYYSAGWNTRTITIGGETLQSVNRLVLLPTSALDFILYAVSYAVYADPPTGVSKVIKITTDDAFATYSDSDVTDTSDFDFTVIGAHNFEDAQTTPILCTVLKERGGGTDLEPTSAFSNFKLIDVIT